MPNKIQVKRSAVAAKVPTTADIDLGEIAINTFDGKMYIKKDNGTASIVQIGGSSGTGDVVGPASSTDNAITRFDGTTGKAVQNSTVTLDDNGNVVNTNSIGFDTTPTTPPTTDGTMSWDDGDGVPSVVLKGGLTILQIGTQEYARVFNDSGTTLTRGQVVYISGAQGNRVAVKLARADVETTSFGTIGLATQTIANGAEGYIIVSGALYKLNTSALIAGAAVYLSTTTAGAYQTTKPQAPDQLVVLGWVERVHPTVGSIYIKIDNGYELNELHDVRITSPQSGNLLIYDASTTPVGVWKNANLTDGTGINITEGAGSVTVNLASGYGDTLNPYASKPANQFLAAPNGSAGVPTFRSIVAADVPTLNQNTTGTASNVTGTVAIANGGTGATTDATARSNLLAAKSGANTDITSIALTTGTISTAPSSSTDIVNKSYADSLVTGVNFHAACNYATTSALPSSTYNNGSSGVGATLTATANGTLSIDGYTFVAGDLNDRILVKNQASAAQNGVYTLTQVGTASLPFILTRATDFNTSGSGANQIDAGDLVLVLSGTTNANTSWVQQTALPITVGTTPIVFVQFAAVQTYTAGTGLTLSTNQFSITSVGTAGTYGSASNVPVITTNAQGQVTSVTNTAIAIAGSAVTGNISGNAANVTGTVAIANGGTGATAATSAIANLKGFTTTATAAGTTTLTVASTYNQFFTGTTTQTIVLPVTTTLVQGWGVLIHNSSTGNLTVNSSGANLVITIPANTTASITCILASGTTAASWEAGLTNLSAASGSQNGYLSSTDWTTFNSKGNGTVTSVTGTSPVASSGGATPAISLSAAYGDTLNPYGSKTAAQVLAAPAATAGVPSFRALVAGDLPTVTVAKGGTGLTSITALSVPVANSANTYSALAAAAGQSIRVNAGGTAWEAYTPAGGGTVTSVAKGNGMNFTTFTTSGTITLGTPGQITSSSSNAVQTSSHTHAIDAATTLVGGIVTVGNQSWSGTKTLSGILCTAFNYASTTSTYVTGSEINHDISASTRHRISATAVRPGSDNTQTSGANGTRWSAVWAATGTIQTSDVTTKRDIASLDDAEKLVAQGIKGLIKKYRFIDAYEKKGEEARIHIGVIAQEVEALFASHGLDAKRYALWCCDTWWEREEEIFMGDANGYKTDTIHYDYEVEGAIKKTRLAIRYDQLLAFMIAAL
jgi:hypothetical protein